ncbi:MAG: hypothetical protein JXK95_12705 [Bacteroidales bacterium]|nr:hypothetical protein [Bacteroidales bacterium]
MKRLFLGLGVISMAVLLNSCGDDTTGLAPDITFDDGTEITLGAGISSATITGEIVAEEKLDKVTVYRVTTASETQIGTYSSFNAGDITTTDDLTYTFRITVDNISEDISVKIEAVDKEGQTASKSISVKVNLAPALKAEFTAILLGAQTSTDPSCLDANTGLRYKIAEDQAKNNAASIDMLYYYGATNLATLAAPNDETVDGTGVGSFTWTSTWSTKNATKFGASSLDYSNVTAAEVNAISGLSASKVTSLDVGTTVAFETADGKKGVLQVTNLNTGASGTITIAVKIQE